MKAKIAVLLALLLVQLCAVAHAQEYYTLPEIREQAAQGWHETYTDKYGREIAVDVDTPVFGEQTAPVLKMVFPGFTEYRDRQNTPYNTVSDIQSGRSATHILCVYGEEVDLDKAYGADYGNDMTLREVYDALVPRIEQQGLSADGFLFNPPRELDILCCLDKTTEELVASAFYLVRLWPKMYGIPVLNHAAAGFRKQGWPIYCPVVTFQMRNQEEYSLYITTLIEQEKLAEDIPLCSLEQVIQNVATYIEAGYVQKVLSLRFGYALYNDPTIVSSRPVSSFDAECYYAVPSWVIECIFSENPKEDAVERVRQKILNDSEFLDEHGGKETMVINAQTGNMLDPFDRSKNGYGDADYKGFISWDDVKEGGYNESKDSDFTCASAHAALRCGARAGLRFHCRALRSGAGDGRRMAGDVRYAERRADGGRAGHRAGCRGDAGDNGGTGEDQRRAV